MRLVHLYTDNINDYFWWLGFALFLVFLITWAYTYYNWRFNASSSDLHPTNNKPTIVTRLLDKIIRRDYK